MGFDDSIAQLGAKLDAWWDEHANSAHFIAYWTLLRWEREGKHAETKS
jgi:hypothetical protein